METLTKLCDSVDLREYAACIVHPLIRVIDTSPELRGVAMNTLTAIVTQMGKNFTIFIPAVFKVCVYVGQIFWHLMKITFLQQEKLQLLLSENIQFKITVSDRVEKYENSDTVFCHFENVPNFFFQAK